MTISTLRLPAIAVGLLLTPVLAACGSGASPATVAGSEITVTATDTGCQLGTSTVGSGSTSFNVTNSGSQITEVYVYAKNGDAYTTVVSEVENIGPGTVRKMTADLAAGTYEIACKPGQTGSGIRATLTVTGASASTSVVAPSSTR